MPHYTEHIKIIQKKRLGHNSAYIKIKITKEHA